MYSGFQQKWRLGQPGNQLVMLIVTLVLAFCIFKFIHVAFALTGTDTAISNQKYYANVLQHFMAPASLERLLHQPWSLLTYMFLHDDVFHMIGNLIWLWVFGFILQDLTGAKTIFPLFIYGGLAGAVLFIGAVQLFPALEGMQASGSLLGGSAGVMAIAIATTLLVPGYRFFTMINGGIPLWVITLLYVIIDLAMIAGMENVGGHLAHIGGGLFGWLFMHQLKKGRDWSMGMNRFFVWCSNLFSPKETPTPSLRGQYHYNTNGTTPIKKMTTLSQKKIDAILDKIGAQGYASLTDEEKQALQRAADDENL